MRPGDWAGVCEEEEEEEEGKLEKYLRPSNLFFSGTYSDRVRDVVLMFVRAQCIGDGRWNRAMMCCLHKESQRAGQ